MLRTSLLFLGLAATAFAQPTVSFTGSPNNSPTSANSGANYTMYAYGYNLSSTDLYVTLQREGNFISSNFYGTQHTFTDSVDTSSSVHYQAYAYDSTNTQQWTYWTVTINPRINQPAISVSPTTVSGIAQGTTIQFTVSGGAGAGALNWTAHLPDNTTSSWTGNPALTFNEAGTYSLSVYNGGDQTYKDSNTVNITVSVVDTTAPSTPTGLTFDSAGTTSITFHWSPSSDNVGVWRYYIYVNGSAIGWSNGPSATVPGLAPSTTYNLQVQAVDAALNASSLSAAISPSTAADTNAPSVPTGLRATAVGVTTCVLAWNPSSDDIGVTQYQVYQGGTAIGTTSSTSYTVSGLPIESTQTFTVRAGDAANNWSATSSGLTVTTSAPVLVGLHAAGYGLTSGQSLSLTSYDTPSSTTGLGSQVSTAAGAGASSWTSIHQYRGFAPGINNQLTLTGGTQREVRFEVPAGYTLFVTVNGAPTPYTNTATIDLTNVSGALTFTLMPNDGTTALDAGYSIDPEISINNVVWSMSLGRTDDGLTLGALTLRKTDLGDPLTIDTLKLTSEAWTQRDDSSFGSSLGATRRMIWTPGCWVWLDDHASAPIGTSHYFEVKVYDPAATPSWNGSTYVFNKNGSTIMPYSHYGLSNGADNNTVVITKNVGQSQQQLTWTLTKANTGTNQTTWTLQRTGGRTLKTVSTVSGTGVGATTTDVVTLTDGVGNVAQTFQKVYQQMPWGVPELLSETDDPNGYNLITTYTYGQTAGQGSYGKLLSVTKPDGTFTAYDYYNDDANFGNLWHTYSRWLDVASTAATASASNAQTVTLTYKPVHGFMCDALDTTTTTVPNGGAAIMIAKSVRNPDFTSTTFNGHKVRKETIQTYYNTSNYLTTTRLSYHPDETTNDNENQLISETSPTGTKVSTIYYKGTFTDNGDSNTTLFRANGANTQWGEYKFNGFSTAVSGSQLVNTWDGQAIDPIYLVPNRSTIELTVMDKGNPAYKVTYVFTGASGGVPSFEFLGEEKFLVNTTTDATTGVATTTKTHSTLRGEQRVQTFTNGRLMSEVGNDGQEIDYLYDTTGLLQSKSIKGVNASGNYAAQGTLYTNYTYDAASRKISETTATSSSPSATGITTTYHYDSAGRLDQQTDPSGLTTTTSYNLANHTTTTTLPGGATKIVTTYADGTTKSVTGTAVVNTYSGVLVNSDGTITRTAYTLRTSDLSNPTAAPRWAKTKTDWLGRTLREEKPAFGGTVAKVYQYDTNGNLLYVQTADGATGNLLLATAFTDYNAYQMPYRTGLDLDGNSDLQTNSTLDRITETDSFYQKDGNGVWWLVNTTAVYNQPGVGTAVTTSTTKTRQNRFDNAGTNVQSDTISIDVFGNQTETKTAVDRANFLVTTTTTVPTSSVPSVSITRNGLLVSQTSTSNLTTTYAYDAYRRLICTSDPRIDGAAFAKDLPARVGYNDQTAAVGARWQKAWDKDTAGFQTTYSYSSTTGRLSAVQAPPLANQAGKFTYFDYSRRGETIRTWGGKTYPVEYAFNDYGEKIAMRTFRGSTDFSGATWPLSDDTDPLNPNPGTWSSGDKTTWSYDAATGALLSKTDAANHSIGYTYTQLGQVRTKTLARGDTITMRYYGDDAGDPLTGELKSEDFSNTTSTNPDVSYTYDRMGHTASVTDAVGTHTYSYDPALLTLTTEVLPSVNNFNGARVLTNKYDTTGTGTKGRSTGFSLGYAGNATADYDVTYGYDTYGRGNAITSAGATFTYGYTTGSNFIGSITDGASFSQTKTWNPNRGLLASIDTKMGTTSKATFQYGVDEWGRRTSLIRSGEVYSRYINQGLVNTWAYDDRSQVTSAQTYYGTSLSDLSYPVEGRSFGYSYDNIGNRLSSSVDGRTTNYNSNALNQITDRVTPGAIDVSGFAPTGSTVSVTALGNSATVDREGDYYHSAATVANGSSAAYGNVTVSSTAPATTTTRKVFVAKNALTSAEQWQYDADGNLLRDDQWTYTWTDENRLASMETRADLVSAAIIPTSDAKHIDFKYDYLGRRAEKIVRGGWNGSSYATMLSDTRFIYHGWNLVGELTASLGSWFVNRAYTWGLDLSGTLAGDGGTGGLLMTQDGATQYVYAYDGNGNVSAVMNRSTGTTVAEYEYGAFGEILRASDTYAQTNPFRFSTQYVDNETGYSYYGNRYYNPQVGRFLDRDLQEETGGLNLYAFCANNGINTYDVLGNSGDDSWERAQFFRPPPIGMDPGNYNAEQGVAFDHNFNENTYVTSYNFGESYNAVADSMDIGTLAVAGQNVTASTAIAVSNIQQAAASNGQTMTAAEALARVQADANGTTPASVSNKQSQPAASSDSSTTSTSRGVKAEVATNTTAGGAISKVVTNNIPDLLTVSMTKSTGSATPATTTIPDSTTTTSDQMYHNAYVLANPSTADLSVANSVVAANSLPIAFTGLTTPQLEFQAKFAIGTVITQVPVYGQRVDTSIALGGLTVNFSIGAATAATGYHTINLDASGVSFTSSIMYTDVYKLEHSEIDTGFYGGSVVVGHELSHALFNSEDPYDVVRGAVWNDGIYHPAQIFPNTLATHDNSSVTYENWVRSALGLAPRLTYHGQPINH